MNLMSIILPVISLVLAIGYYVFFDKSKKTVKKKEDGAKTESEKTAHDYTNVRDIKGNCLYTKDDKVFMYIRIQPISVDLLSKNEKITLIKNLTAELSAYRDDFKLLAVSRPVDITNQLNVYKEKAKTVDDPIQKELLKYEMSVLGNHAMNSEIVERLFYFCFWDDVDNLTELRKNVNAFKDSFKVARIDADIIGEKEIIRLANLINNPAYTNLEDTEYMDIGNLILGD